MATCSDVADLSYGFYSVATDQTGAQAITKVEAGSKVYLPMAI